MLDYLRSARFYESVVVVLIGLIILAALKAADKKYLLKKSKNDGWYLGAKRVFDFLSIITVVVSALFILAINGVNVGKYFASLGIAGIAIGFAAQDLLKDLVMGASIIVESYFKPGDVVIYNNRYGKVLSFTLKTTKLFMLDDESLMSVPNRNITDIAVASDWFDVDIPIGYDVNLYFARYICKECCKRIERLKHVYSADYINTQEFASSWIVYRVRVHCLVEKRYALKRAANAVIQDVFNENNLGFPYDVKIIQNADPNAPVIGADFIAGKSKEQLNEYKKVYELGSGAVSSKRVRIEKNDKSIKHALDEAERYAASENLDKKQRMRIRLLSEEILTLTKSIAEINSGEFYVERSHSGYQICISADADMDFVKKEKLLEISSDGNNEAFTGAGGSILNAIDSIFLMKNKKMWDDTHKNRKNAMSKSISSSDGDYKWSLNTYNEAKEHEKNSAYDSETVKMSVLNHLADDVKISVKGNHIEIDVLVTDN